MNLVEGMKRAGFKTGNVIALTGTASQNNVTDRMATFKAYMKKFPQYKIVAIEDTNWDQATSAKVAQQLLSKYASKGGIQGAYGMADNMAIGIIQGAKQAGVPVGLSKKNGLIVTGSNCLAVGINAIKAGAEYGTGTQAPQVEAALAVKVGTQILNGSTPKPKVQYVEEQRITRRERREVHEGLHLLASRLAARSMSGERDPAASSGSRSPSDRPTAGARPARGRRPLEVLRPGARRTGALARRASRRGARDLRAQRRRQEHPREGPRRARPARRRA